VSWQAAWASPVYRAYAFIIAGLLALGAVALVVVGRVLKKDVSKVWVIWRSWLIMAPLGMVVVALGREASIAGGALLALLGFKEYARATGLYRDRAMTLVVYGAIVVMAVAAWVADPTTGGARLGWFGLMQAMPIYAVAAIWVVPIARNRVVGQLQAVGLATLGFLYVGWMFGHLAFLVNTTNAYGYVLFVIFAVEICDIAAYTFGKLFGRRALRSNVSPKKTWGGSIGGLAVAMALPWALWFSFPASFDWRAKILTGLIVGIGGQLGDLSISVLKRDLGIKDMGAAIPGHGGVLDRIDSLIFVAPLFVRLVGWFEPLR
jgi:phosphatidate cytidylyltransferase